MTIHQNIERVIKFIAKPQLRPTRYSTHGFSLVEVTTVTAIAGVLAAIAAPNILFGHRPLADTTNRVAANLKLIRAKAMAQTSAYRITPVSTTQLLVEYAQNCDVPDADWSRDPGFANEDLVFDDGVEILAVTENSATAPVDDWSLCYNSRGYANKNVTLTLSDSDDQQVIELFPGGTVDS